MGVEPQVFPEVLDNIVELMVDPFGEFRQPGCFVNQAALKH
jgi:hypothetical protein